LLLVPLVPVILLCYINIRNNSPRLVRRMCSWD